MRAPFGGWARRRGVDADQAWVRRLLLPAAIAAATIAGFVVVSLQLSGGALHHAAHPNWPLLATAFVVVALAQPLRAMAWRATLRSAVDFKAVYAASAVGSFLDTVLPARLGEASKVGVLRVSAGSRWPGFPRATGSLLCAHLLEALAFLVVGAAAAAFLPFPDWARWTMVGGFALAAGAIGVAALLHHKLGRRAAPARWTASSPRRPLLRASSPTPAGSSSRRGSSAGSASCSCSTRSESRRGSEPLSST